MLPINCDLGEQSYLSFENPDELVFPHIQLCNIACGYHAGNPAVMMHSLLTAAKYSVKAGAHPSFPDMAGFGRNYIDIPLAELKNMIFEQVSSLESMAQSAGIKLHHVKAHGALYNAAMQMEKEAQAIIDAVKMINKNLIILCQPQSLLSEMADQHDMRIMTEGFADRLYDDDLKLTSRELEGSLYKSKEKIRRQIKQLNDGFLTTISGEIKAYKVDTICIHSDNTSSVAAILPQ
jgi:5-oxoprolinase (ATP-hydrolysing) subunit A